MNICVWSYRPSIRRFSVIPRRQHQRHQDEEGFTIALVSKPAKGPAPTNWKAGGYLQKIPADPWGYAYKYTSPGQQADYEVVSFGADGVRGGEGKNADIVSWDLDKKS